MQQEKGAAVACLQASCFCDAFSRPPRIQPVDGSRHVQGLAEALTVSLHFAWVLVQALATQAQRARFLGMPAESCQPSA